MKVAETQELWLFTDQGIAVIALIISLVGALFSAWSHFSNRNTTYQSLIASERTEALSRFSEGFGEYSAHLDDMIFKIPYRFEDPTVIANLSDDELRELAGITKGALNEYRKFTTRVTTSLPAWSDAVQEEIKQSGDAANKLQSCLFNLERLPTTLHGGFFEQKRALIAQTCSIFPTERTAFEDRSQIAIRSMINERRAAWREDIPKVRNK